MPNPDAIAPAASAPRLDFSLNPAAATAEASAAEHQVRGEVLRIVFARDDGDYSVLRVLTPERREVTVVGPLGTVMEGQDIEAWGRWETHREHGRQLRVSRFKVLQPTTPEGIRRYLASGVLPGIGKVYAERIVAHFGERTLDILDNFPARLADVAGLGKKRVQQIREAWKTATNEREVHVYLQGLGIGTSHCHRIVQRYGHAAPEVVRQNPYQLAGDIHGIGFLSADRIARNLGIERSNPLRLQAGVGHVLAQMAEQQGHVCLPEPLLLQEAARILEVAPAEVAIGLQRALLDGSVVADGNGDGDGGRVLYPRELFAAETGLAESLESLLRSRAGAPPPPPATLTLDPRLNAEQRQAVLRAFAHRLGIITGGPGVGKTTVVGQIVANARRRRWRLLLAAPTGRAAKRLSESCGLEAKTIHRLLHWDPQKGTFVHNRQNPLRGDLLVVDEASMLDVELADHLFRAVAPETRVVLVGDRDQLPSVGPGAVLHDLIACGRLPVTALAQIYRQDEHSRIVTNAHAVNRGEMPDLRPPPEGVHGDFYWLDQEDPEKAADQIARMVAERIPATFHLQPQADIQVLAPMNKGVCGTLALNDRLQAALNGRGWPEFRVGDRLFRNGDRVMQVTNNYDKGVFNGEMGRIAAVEMASKRFTVRYDLGPVDYGFHEADQIRLAYAVTVHKSQGCEFPAVVLPLLSQHFIMLQRNLLYTAMTRAKRLLVLVGTRKALAIAVRNDRPALRFTRLAARLAAAGRN
ncbi:MAG: ATP-dependent RecD-like DNA helicase [Lentisphaeria bacterium]|jgi:exodeoxyribonuclease V alpha subunit